VAGTREVGRWYRIVRLRFSSGGSKAWTLSSHWDTTWANIWLGLFLLLVAQINVKILTGNSSSLLLTTAMPATYNSIEDAVLCAVTAVFGRHIRPD
jgi:hypothetical protein